MPFEQDFVLSFEMFPPKTEEGFQHLEEKIQQLNRLKPKFFSVTFGAAGSTQPQTPRVVQNLVANHIAAVPHISCINMTKQHITALLHQYRALKVQQLIVIRGDYPADNPCTQKDFEHASDLVAYIRDTTGDYFHIIVAAYPEFHPQAKSPQWDLKNFKRKVDAGANSAITQYFFNSDSYFRLLENCDKLNITVPITPGIMPIMDYNKLLKFSTACGAEVPLWIRKYFENGHKKDESYLNQCGIEIVTQLCQKLVVAGVKGLHFYTLNHVEPVATIVNNLGASQACAGQLSKIDHDYVESRFL